MMVQQFFRGILVTLLFISFRVEAVGQTETSSYGELQAAYLYNFAKYIKWPGEMPSFTIGVYGEAEIMTDLEGTLKGKKIGGREIILLKITADEQITQCNIIYLAEANSKNLNILLGNLAGNNILIVTEEDLIKKGAMISFVVEDDKLRFKLKKAALNRSKLVASEGLLRLAILQ